MRSAPILLGLLSLVLVESGCGDSGGSDLDPGSSDAGFVAADSGTTTAQTCEAVTVTCQDQSIQQLPLFTAPSPAAITDESVDTDNFITFIDSSGGGIAPNQSYVYARFTEQGLEKVAIGDEAALESTDWDVAFRRFVIRFNSGVSGPSCVGVGRTAPGTTFAGLTSVPANLDYRTEEYFSASCELITDSGIGSPATAMISYWTYQACVEMTGNVYVISLADGRFVKLEVLSYYTQENQDICNATGAVPIPSGSGNTRIRWAFIEE